MGWVVVRLRRRQPDLILVHITIIIRICYLSLYSTQGYSLLTTKMILLFSKSALTHFKAKSRRMGSL